MINYKSAPITQFLLSLLVLTLGCSLPAVATQQPVAQPVTQSPLPTLKITQPLPSETSSTSTPVAPPAVVPTSTPIAPPAVIPTSTPIAPPAVTPSLTPIAPPVFPPTPTLGSTPSQMIPYISFNDFTNLYFRAVVDGDYSTAWNMLSPTFKSNSHSDDYKNYVQGYTQMQLCDIVISNFQNEESSAGFAKASAHFVYKTGKNCAISEYDFNLYFIYDGNQKNWLLDGLSSK